MTYEAERKVCIEERRASTDLTFEGQTRTWDGADQNQAEYACSTVDLAKKYYSEDPEGIIELCVRTGLVGMYTYENGLGSVTRKQLEELHAAGTFTDVTMDDQGNVTIGDATLEQWRGLCKDVIENVVNTEE